MGAAVAVDMASSCAPGCRALEDVLMHGQDYRHTADTHTPVSLFSHHSRRNKKLFVQHT